MRRLHIAEKWNKYANATVPKDASEIQRKETRRAFYAGCAILLVLISEPKTDQEAQDLTQEIMQELREFPDPIGTMEP